MDSAPLHSRKSAHDLAKHCASLGPVAPSQGESTAHRQLPFC